MLIMKRMRQDKTIEVFSLLVRAGLFGRTEGADSLLQDGVDWAEVSKLAKEQSVVGLVAEGVEVLKGESVMKNGATLLPKEWLVKYGVATMRLEQRNQAMNKFIATLIRRMRKQGIYALLLKGQGVAQCYTKPLWRACGDVDLLLSDDDYEKARDFLTPFASKMWLEHQYKKHLGMTIGNWLVELHGHLRCGFSFRIDKELDKIYHDTFCANDVTSWMNRKEEVFMLGRENDVLYVFVHFLNHFYKGGVGLRQICDWCRLLWSYRDALDLRTLESRLKKMGLMSEWRAFGAYAVEYLGMPEETMPFYDDDEKWKRKARRIWLFILKTGNMGHNRDKGRGKVSFLTRKLRSSAQRFTDLCNHLTIFPLDTLRFLPSIFITGLRQK